MKEKEFQKTIVACALGECVHVAGITNFLRLAEQTDWHTIFLGPAVSIEDAIQAAVDHKANILAVSYRLTPETGEQLLAEFAESADHLKENGVQIIFGGTPPVAEKAKNIGFFDYVFGGSETIDDTLNFLRGTTASEENISDTYPQSAIERIVWKKPFPLLRHHFGQPTMAATIAGIKKISAGKALDIISLGIDQDAQENFFHPERQDVRKKGAGGVPVRTPKDYRMLFEATRIGNFPLLRTYSGTNDFIQLADMYVKTINNAWAAIPIFWFNQMDGRGPWDLSGSIREHQKVMAWYGKRNIPVECNEPHHWGMRDAPDVVFVVSAYISAYNAQYYGVKDYIAQMMFNSPPATSDLMDLAKMQASLEICQPLINNHFQIHRQTRTGLLSYPLDPNAARAHLSASIYLQMALKPDIVHIVGHTEAHHAATADDIIDASKMAQRVIENAINGQPDMLQDKIIQDRKNHLISEAKVTIQAIQNNKTNQDGDPLLDAECLSQAVADGILDAPHLKNNRYAKGEIRTAIIDGGCEAVDEKGEIIPESERLHSFL